MSRQALDVIGLALENADGETTRMGVTSEHPLFTVGQGWVDAGELTAGDVIRDSELRELRVLSIEVDTQPHRVHNLEVADAHTYFAGELEAWGHNAKYNSDSTKKKIWAKCKGICITCGIKMVFKGPRKGPRKDRFTIGHKYPKSKYPEWRDELWNLDGQCCSCNAKQGTKIPHDNVNGPPSGFQ
jgi:hypothetical protein